MDEIEKNLYYNFKRGLELRSGAIVRIADRVYLYLGGQIWMDESGLHTDYSNSRHVRWAGGYLGAKEL